MKPRVRTTEKQKHKQLHRTITSNLTEPNQSVKCSTCGVEVFASSNTLRHNSKRIRLDVCPVCNLTIYGKEYELKVAERDGEHPTFTCRNCDTKVIVVGFNPIELKELIPEEENEHDEEVETDYFEET